MTLTDREIHDPPVSARPNYLVPIIDPTFGTKVTRVSNPNHDVPNIGVPWTDPARHHYSLDQAWNADQTLLMLDRGTSGNLYLDGTTYEVLFRASAPGHNRWHPINPRTQIILKNDSVFIWEPVTDVQTLVAVFPGYSGLHWESKGNPSHDGTRLVACGNDPSGNRVCFVYDLQTDTKYTNIPLGVGISYATISATGDHIVVFGNFNANDQTQIYSPDGIPVGPLWAEYHRPGHMDQTIDGAGDEVAVGTSKTDPDKGRVIKRRLIDGQITILTPSGWASHTSARNIQLPGWVFSTFSSGSGSYPPYNEEIVAVKMDGSLEVRRLVHTQSAKPGGYYAEPHGSPSPDGSKVIFASNWQSVPGPVAAYVVQNLGETMTTVMYRINGNEVIKISPNNQLFPNIDRAFFEVLTDPSLPDGTDIQEDLGNGNLGPRRELGFAKFADVGGNICRNATAPEIALMVTAEVDDTNQLDADQATGLTDVHPMWRKLLKAMLKVIINEVMATSNVKINAVVDQWNQHKADIAAAGNLNDVKTLTAALPTITSDLTETATVAQAVTKIKGFINKDD